MELFFAPQSWPFLLALVLLIILAVIEGMALLLGFSLSGWLDELIPEPPAGEGAGFFDAWLGWLHVGKVPVLIIFAILLTAFSVLGFVLNGLVQALFGFYLPSFVAAVAAFCGALPVVRISAAAIARLVPYDESSAEPLENLVGHVAVIINGTARKGYPAQARVKNAHGRTLYVHVEPDGEDVSLNSGESVLLVKQISGSRFLAIANPHPELL